jgi:hypothetical protein
MASTLLASPALLSLRPRAPAGLRVKAAGLRTAPVARRSVVVASGAAPAVGGISFGGNGKVGTASFTPAAKKGPNFKVIAAVGIGLPTLAAIATAAAVPLADQAFAAAPLKGPLLVTFLAAVTYFWTVMQVTSAVRRNAGAVRSCVHTSSDTPRAPFPERQVQGPGTSYHWCERGFRPLPPRTDEYARAAGVVPPHHMVVRPIGVAAGRHRGRHGLGHRSRDVRSWLLRGRCQAWPRYVNAFFASAGPSHGTD